MQISRVTPGVERILNRARQLVAKPIGENCSLNTSSGRCSKKNLADSEILGQFQITAEIISMPTAPSPLENKNANADIDAGELVGRIFSTAGMQAARHGRYEELGSEHLLFGLVAVDSEVAFSMRERGLTAEVLKGLIDEIAGHSEDPLAVDFQFAEVRTSACDETDLYRILDAAANRVREGVRVLEDYARFARDDSFFTSELKTWRHDFRVAISQVDEGKLLRSRDSGSDVGTNLNTPAERHRNTLDDVLKANCKRVQEGLRTLEEYGKILSPVVGEAVSMLRYRFYTLEKRLIVEAESREKLAGRNIYVLATRDQCRLEMEIAIRIAMNAGANVIQLREKHLADRELMELGQKMREWTREFDALFIMNDRPDLAVLLDADGVHIGQEELTVRQVRRIVGPNRLIGVSTHTIAQARQAVEAGADYLGVGPVFPSQTKDFAELAGLDFVRQVAAEIRLPWYAIGGITPENLPELQSAGATRIAISQAVCGSASPADVVTNLKEGLDNMLKADR